jgi:hypothetical protein
MTHSRYLFLLHIAGLTILFLACSDDPVGKPAEDAGVALPVDSGVDADGPDDENLIPCEPRAVLQTVCQQCHTRPTTKNGAPFPIVRHSDILAVRSGGGGATVRDRMIDQLRAGRMPLAPATIEPTQKTMLLTWLEEGAPTVEATDCQTDGGDGGDQ